MKDLFDHRDRVIKRLQNRVKNIESQQRVRCTDDGEYPAEKEQVIFTSLGRKSYIGYFTTYDGVNTFIANDGYAYYSDPEVFYWKPYTNLLEQYREERR